MENQFGDILSDLGAGIVGGLGMAPSAEVGEAHGLFQPSHGSAPQLAGKNVANPLAMILAAAVLLSHAGEEHEQAGRAIREAALEAVAGGVRTADLGGDASTSEFTDEVIRRTRQKLEVWSAL
jgi:3-isopropylmalate dehydrogenase